LPYIKHVIFYLAGQPTNALQPLSGAIICKRNPWRLSLKTLLILGIVSEALYPFIVKGEWNDDDAPRGFLHGAYEVSQNATAEALTLKRLFIHRDGYLIFQYQDEQMEDYKLHLDSANNTMELLSNNNERLILYYNFEPQSQQLSLVSADSALFLNATSLPWRDLPVLQPLFHWTVDSVQE